MYQYEPKHDLSALTQHEYNLVVLLMSIAGRPAFSTVDYGMNTWMRKLFPDGATAASELTSKGWATTSVNLHEALNCYTVSEIKTLLRLRGLKQTGLKSVLLSRLLPSLSEEEQSRIISSVQIWRPTPLGYEYIRSLYAEREAVEHAVLAECQAHNFDMAAKLGLDYKNRFLLSDVGSGDAFSHSFSDIDLLSRFYANTPMTIIDAVACFKFLFGSALMFPPEADDGGGDIQAAADLKIRYLLSSMYLMRSLESYMKSGIEYCQILGTLDARSCPQCALIDGALVRVIDAMVGYNVPPFHDGCRCTTVAYLPEPAHEDRTRWARDPVTRQGYYVPANYSYLDWYQSLTPEQKQQIATETRVAVEAQLKYGGAVKL